MHYRPDKFEQLYRRENGTALWNFLLEHDNLVRMEAATYLGRPAVEPLSPFLLQRFGGEVTRAGIKRMIGHMIRQIMESRGFALDRSGVTIKRAGNIFYCASRYRAA